MSKELTIQSIRSKPVNTKYGEKIKYLVRFAEKPELLVDVWAGNWNNGWTKGARVNIEDSQWQSREYNGQTYWSIRAPEGAREEVSWTEFNALKQRVEALEASLLQKEDNIPVVGGEPPIEDYNETDFS